MKRLLLSLSYVLLSCLALYAQDKRIIQGTVRDSLGILPGTSVKLTSASDSLSAITDMKGSFSFSSVRSHQFKLTVTSIGFKPFIKSYSVDPINPVIKLPAIILKDNFNQLNEVVINALIPVRVKEDTVEFDARAYKVREGDAVEEMVKKLPGMEVSKDGSITTQGQAITKVRLNGKDFFGDDAQAAIQNLPADIVQNLQVIDDYGVQANLSGIKSGEPQKILNINTKPDKKNGYFSKAEAGMGTEDRYAGRFRANKFSGDQQLAFDGVMDNTRGSSAGTTDSKSLKFNYRDKWGDKLESYGSYRFNNSNNNTFETVYSQNIFQDYTRFDDENNAINKIESTHRLSWNFEYQIDKNNYIKVEPDISYNPSKSSNSGLTLTRLLSSSSSRQNSSFNKSLSSDLGTEIFYNHKFGREGRNFSLNADLGYSRGDQDRDVNNEYVLTDSLNNSTYEAQYQLSEIDNINKKTRLRLSYTEPLSKFSFLELNYDWNRSHTESARSTDDINPVDGSQTRNLQLSNNYNYDFTTNRIGLTYRVTKNNLNYIVGLSAEPALLRGEDISRSISTSKHTFNWVPAARLAYKFSKKHSIVARYYGRNNQPGFSQLQPITDNSNLQNTITGNPDLKPEFIHNFGVEYRQSDWGTGYTMFTNLVLSQTQNKIVSSRVILPESLRQQTSYINANGFYNAKASYTFSKPFAERKLTLSYSGSADYSNNIAYTNNERNVGKNMVISQGLKFRFDLEDIIDTELNTSYAHTNTSYSSASFSDRKLNRYFIGLSGRNYFFKDLTLGYDLSQTINKGYNSDNANPTLLSLYLEHRFLKGNKGTIRLQAFDLFNQNTGISRDVFDNEIIDRQNNRLARYFLLSFNFRMQKFGI
ncbi:outer membrane beta-barrel family protein [Desertivirga xinjiangensis]|uniref:outer membrane beta-barrel family protein n=1 Tax=Desertivirga xinjiangensis TaxID=539206 RepID=UPI00210DA146|nr:outer membrane beta-barrel family protein [Pedobacter xinjiangensis]